MYFMNMLCDKGAKGDIAWKGRKFVGISSTNPVAWFLEYLNDHIFNTLTATLND